ncbi:hypothetical protein KUCAC02_035674 [Chaenocephalus aceratus]|nr:hypothetical protein KUCAC02_035674 [Chaenocephalus aceratus]
MVKVMRANIDRCEFLPEILRAVAVQPIMQHVHSSIQNMPIQFQTVPCYNFKKRPSHGKWHVSEGVSESSRESSPQGVESSRESSPQGVESSGSRVLQGVESSESRVLQGVESSTNRELPSVLVLFPEW